MMQVFYSILKLQKYKTLKYFDLNREAINWLNYANNTIKTLKLKYYS